MLDASNLKIEDKTTVTVYETHKESHPFQCNGTYESNLETCKSPHWKWQTVNLKIKMHEVKGHILVRDK